MTVFLSRLFFSGIPGCRPGSCPSPGSGRNSVFRCRTICGRHWGWSTLPQTSCHNRACRRGHGWRSGTCTGRKACPPPWGFSGWRPGVSAPPASGLPSGMCRFHSNYFIQSADMEIPRAVFPGTPVVRRAAYFRAGDIVVKAEEPGIGSGRIFGAEMGFSAVDGGITLFLSRAGSPSTWVKGFSILYWIFLPSGEDGWFRMPWSLPAGCR